jgi:formylglycine-generating enzyme required for sulfatase activity
MKIIRQGLILLFVAGFAYGETDMVLIPAGTNSGNDPDFGKYSLAVEAFYMDSTEVTKGLWDEVYKWAIKNGYVFDNPGTGTTPNHPVQQVSWYDCAKWCNARSEKEKLAACYLLDGRPYKTGLGILDCDYRAGGYRLPTNTEWEYAARGGLEGMRFPWGEKINNENAHYVSAQGSKNCPSYDRGVYDRGAYDKRTGMYSRKPEDAVVVKQFPPNGFGLYDMAGNAREWCDNDLFTLHRTIRDGMGATRARCGYTEFVFPDYTEERLGFRSVRNGTAELKDRCLDDSEKHKQTPLEDQVFISSLDFSMDISSEDSRSDGSLGGYLSGPMAQKNKVADFENKSRFYVITLKNTSLTALHNVEVSYSVYYEQAIPGAAEPAQKYSRSRTITLARIDSGAEMKINVPAVTVSKYRAYFRVGSWVSSAPANCEGGFQGITVEIRKRGSDGDFLSRQASCDIKDEKDLPQYRSQNVGFYKDQEWSMSAR